MCYTFQNKNLISAYVFLNLLFKCFQICIFAILEVSDFFVFPLWRKSEVDDSSPWPNNSLLYQLPRLPREHSGKEFACWCRRCKRRKLDPWVGKIPWRRNWQPTPVSLPGKSHGQRCLEGYCPWGHERVGHNWAAEHISVVCKEKEKMSVRAACLEIGLARFALVRDRKTLWFSSILHFPVALTLKFFTNIPSLD